jgi:hypothetical protein
VHGSIFADPGILHIAQVFAPGHGALAKGLTLDGLKKIVRATGFNAGFNQVTHNVPTYRKFAAGTKKPVELRSTDCPGRLCPHKELHFR